MLTPTTIARLEEVNDLLLAFASTTASIGTPPTPLSNAQVYMDLVIKELSLDVLKRN
jgi:hypothetical protein